MCPTTALLEQGRPTGQLPLPLMRFQAVNHMRQCPKSGQLCRKDNHGFALLEDIIARGDRCHLGHRSRHQVRDQESRCAGREVRFQKVEEREQSGWGRGMKRSIVITLLACIGILLVSACGGEADRQDVGSSHSNTEVISSEPLDCKSLIYDQHEDQVKAIRQW